MQKLWRRCVAPPGVQRSTKLNMKLQTIIEEEENKYLAWPEAQTSILSV